MTVVEETGYPFKDEINFTLQTPNDVQFPLELRIPGWAKQYSIAINGEEWRSSQGEGGQMVKIDRTWSDGDQVTLRLPMEVRVSRWAERSAGIERGPLAYALKIGEQWEQQPPEQGNWRIQHPYYEVTPTDPWNFGIIQQSIDSLNFEVTYHQEREGAYPWNLENVPVELKTMGKQVPDWSLYQHAAGPLPASGQYLYGHTSSTKNISAEEITLVPYGATTLRISQFPVVN